ncbi:MAG: hypothetical protein WCO06_02915 [Candidatus Roizmanbacteria bacterium]
MKRQLPISEKQTSTHMKEIFRRYGKDTSVTDTKGAEVWLKKIGYPALADLISDEKK